MKFNQLRILTYLTEAFKKDLVFNSKELEELLEPYWEYVPDDINFTIDSFDAIDISTNKFIFDDGKQQAKMFKTLRSMFPKDRVDDNIIKQIIDVLIKNKTKTSMDNPIFDGFEFWKGSIYNLYKLGGSNKLIKSCMTDKDIIHLTKFYDWINGHDPEFKPTHTVRVKGLIHKNEEGQIDGRALVWYGVEGTGGKLFMDRVYPDTMATIFHKYAEAKGWAYRQGRGHGDYQYLVGAKDISIQIDMSNYNPDQLVPYMDTFVGINTKTGVLKNTKTGLRDLQNETEGTQLTDLPNWFQDNLDKGNIKNAEYRMDIMLIWIFGVWKNGDWINGNWWGGTWEKGTWKGGTWLSGIWVGGLWKGGTWQNGIWKGGTWEGGTWEGGSWEGGSWEGGTWVKGWIYDPGINGEKQGKKEYVDKFEWDRDYVKSPISPRDYFGQAQSPYLR